MSETTPPTSGEPMDGSVAPSALGASASVAAGSKRSARGEGRAGSLLGKVPRPKLGPGRGLALFVVAVVLLAMVPLLGTSLKKTPKDKVGISYGGGPIEGAEFQRIVEPGSSLFFNGIFDPLYLYPADQQNYIVSNVAREGDTEKKDSVVAPSKDRVQVSYELAVYYKLNTDLLQKFHEEFGLKYKAYTASGWKALIEDTFRQQIENALLEETRKYDVSDIYGDADLLLTIQNSVQETLSERLELAMGTEYFCAPTFEPGGQCDDPTFVIKTINIPKSVVSAFEANQTSRIAILTKANEVEQRQKEAEGIAALNAAFGENGMVYALLKAIESGSIPFWVIPDDTGLTLPTAPDGAAPSADGAAPAPTTAPPTTSAPTTTTAPAGDSGGGN